MHKGTEKSARPDGVKLRKRGNITVNIVTSVLVLLMVFSVIAIAIGYWQFSDRFTEEYSDNAIRIAQAAEVYLDADNFDQFLAEGEDSFNYESYATPYTTLQALCDRVNAQFIYVIIPDTSDYGHITFVMNIVNTDSPFERYKVGYVRETTNDDYREKYRMIMEGESTEELVVRDKGFIESGSHITAMIPLYSETEGKVAAILCVQRQMDALTSSRKTFTVRVIIALGVIVLLAAIAYIFLLNRSLIRPIKTITKETERFSSDPTPAAVSLASTVKGRAEIAVLAQSVDRMEHATLENIENLTRATAERQRIGTELELASQIQQNMLNHVFPEHPSFEIFASMTPAKEVGGDFYDFFMLDDDRLGIVIADVSGKGVPAALFMMITKILIIDTAMMYSSPAEILRSVNERICANNQLDMFVTVWLGILDLRTGRLTASNAGHEYPMIRRADGPYELLKDKHGFVIGGMSGMKFTDYELTLQEGDAIFVYTDGLAEATDMNEQIFGVERVIAALNEVPQPTPFATLAQVQSSVDAFVGDAPQFDDLTMLCLKYKGRRQDDANVIPGEEQTNNE